MNLKTTEENFFRGLSALLTYGLIFLLGFIIFEIVKKGIPSLSWEMITQTPKGGFYFGKEGGILNAIMGTVYLSLGASVLAFMISLPVALYINIGLVRKKRIQHSIRFILDILWGIPPIVYGAFGFMLMLTLGMTASLLSGTLTIMFLISPIMIRAMDEALQNAPMGLMEASFSLGATRYETAFKVFLRQSLPGIVTAFLLGFSKGVGDTAAVLFTAGYTDYVPRALTEPAATLPLAIFFQLSSPVPEVKSRAFAAAMVLTILILIISLASRLLSSKLSKSSIQ